MPPVESDYVEVPREIAERARRLLAARGLLRRGLRPARGQTGVRFPVTSASLALKVLEAEGLQAVTGRGVFEEYPARGPRRLPTLVKGYTVLGDVAVFGFAPGVPIEEYERAARELVESGRFRAVYLREATEGPYRTPKLRLLAGEPVSVVSVREYGLTFKLDVHKVYFNPRLQEERRRVALQARDGENVLDMFAGVGPFSIHIASARRATVVGVDWNPHAVYYMAVNVRLNRRRLLGSVWPVYADASTLSQVFRRAFNRVIMNNPTGTPAYLGVACDLSLEGATIHYYRLHYSCEDAASEALEASPCRVRVAGCRRVIEHSPTTAVYALDLVREG